MQKEKAASSELNILAIGALVHKHLIVLAWRHAVVMSGKHGTNLVNQSKIANDLPPPRSVRLSTASIRRSNDAASNSTLLPENLDSFTPTFKKQDNLAEYLGGSGWAVKFPTRRTG